MKNIQSLFASFLLMAFVGCSAAAPAGSPLGPVSTDPSGTSIRLQRSICFGRCPAYAVTLHEDGRVEFAGELHVAVNGSSKGQADPVQTASLFTRLRSPEFQSLSDQYQPGDKSCGRWATDMPTVKMDVTLNGHTRHFVHYTGCSAVPPLLTEIERQVDAVSGSRRWIAGEDVR